MLADGRDDRIGCHIVSYFSKEREFMEMKFLMNHAQIPSITMKTSRGANHAQPAWIRH